MTSVRITLWQARLLLLMSLEPQSAKEVADRLAERGMLLEPSRVRLLLDELTQASLLQSVHQKGRTGGRYWLNSGPAVETTLDEAYALIKG